MSRPLFLLVLICFTVQGEECNDRECVTDDLHLIQREVAVRLDSLALKTYVVRNGTNGTVAAESKASSGAAKDCASMADDYLAKWWCELEETFSVLNPIDEYIVTGFISWLIQMILALLVYTFCYPREPELFINPSDPVATFKKEHFGCFKRPSICICAMCCPAVQWGDTMHLAGLLKAPFAMALFFTCVLLNGFTFMGVTMYGLFTATLIIIYRQRLREKLGLENWTAPNLIFDCCYVCCCTCCAIAQEAQVVRYAYQLHLQEEKAPKTEKVVVEERRYLDARLAPVSSIQGSVIMGAPAPASSGSLRPQLLTTSLPPSSQVITTPLARDVVYSPARSLPATVL